MHADYFIFCMDEKSAFEPQKFKKKAKKIPIRGDREGGDKWTRTTDSRIFSPMLYQLSYITDS
jgi:hypothetical protein